MSETYLLIDFENVHTFDLTNLPATWRIKVFVGASQGKPDWELVKQAQPLGPRMEWIRISGNGKNALDFHIAFYMGEHAAKSVTTEFVLLSKDTGFDPLIDHMKERGIQCRRVISLNEWSTPVTDFDLSTEHVLALLSKGDKKARPRRRSTLTTHLASKYQKRLSAAQVEEIVERLFAGGHITEVGKALNYNF